MKIVKPIYTIKYIPTKQNIHNVIHMKRGQDLTLHYSALQHRHILNIVYFVVPPIRMIFYSLVLHYPVQMVSTIPLVHWLCR